MFRFMMKWTENKNTTDDTNKYYTSEIKEAEVEETRKRKQETIWNTLAWK